MTKPLYKRPPMRLEDIIAQLDDFNPVVFGVTERSVTTFLSGLLSVKDFPDQDIEELQHLKEPDEEVIAYLGLYHLVAISLALGRTPKATVKIILTRMVNGLKEGDVECHQ